MMLELKRRDQTEALEGLRRGAHEAMTTSGQRALDQLAHLALVLIEVERERAGIPDELLLPVLAVLPFVEELGLSAAAGQLLEDAAILLRLGFSIQQVQNGFNERHRTEAGSAETPKPCHPEVLREELAWIDPRSIAAFRQRVIEQLFEGGLVKGKTYAIDGTGLKDCHRLVGVVNIHKDRALWLNWRLMDANASEKGGGAYLVRQMVAEIRAAGGAEAMEWLVMDALYADGLLLAW